MSDAVRPGGWLLIEEDDMGSMLSVDVTDSSAAPFAAIFRSAIDTLREKRILDYYFGRRVRGLVEELGFSDIGQEGWTCIARGGEPLALYQAMTGPVLVSRGIITREQNNILQRYLQDPTFYYPFYTLFCAWGRKPVDERKD